MLNKKILILGAGFTGLCSGYQLQKHFKNVTILEKATEPGGYARTIEYNGNYLDYGEHFIRIPDEEVKNFFEEIYPGGLIEKPFKSRVYLNNAWHEYPFQKHLFNLTTETKLKCLRDFLVTWKADRIDRTNFFTWLKSHYGNGLVEEFFLPYNKKIWSIHPKDMSCDWFFSGDVVPRVEMEEILKGALQEPEVDWSSRARYYPKDPGVFRVVESLTRRLTGPELKKEVVEINPGKKQVRCSDSSVYDYDILINTIPVPDFLKMITGDFEFDAEKIKYNSAYMTNFILNSETGNDNHWLYFPEENFRFSRVYFQKNFNEKNVVNGQDIISTVTTFLPDSQPDKSQVIENSVSGLLTGGLLSNRDQVQDTKVIFVKHAFPLPLQGLREEMDRIKERLSAQSIFTIGRYGNWEYAGLEHAVRDGIEISKRLTG